MRKQSPEKTSVIYVFTQPGPNADMSVNGPKRTAEIRMMDEARISDGPHKTPKGLHHGQRVNTFNNKVPLNMVNKWVGVQ